MRIEDNDNENKLQTTGLNVKKKTDVDEIIRIGIRKGLSEKCPRKKKSTNLQLEAKDI